MSEVSGAINFTQITLSEVVVCPLCDARGFDDTQANQLSCGKGSRHGNACPSCRLCHGTKFFDRSYVCTCGYPAVFTDDKSKVRYCGHKTCLDYLKLHPPGTTVTTRCI